MLWEKIVASASRKMVAIVDESKRVQRLGRFPLPVEVIPFAWKSTERHLQRLFKKAGYMDTRIDVRGGREKPLVTDSGQHDDIRDCQRPNVGKSVGRNG